MVVDGLSLVTIKEITNRGDEQIYRGKSGVKSINWEQPPLQEVGSKDCKYFAPAYICRLLGFNTKWTDIRDWVSEDGKKYAEETYPYRAYGINPHAAWWGKNAMDWQDYRCFSRTEGFKKFILQMLSEGCIGYAHIFLVEHIGHAVILLEADEEGVLFADSIRGLVKDSWDKFINPLGKDHRYVSRVETWYKVQ